MKKALAFSNRSVSQFVQSYQDSESRGANIYSSFQRRYQQLNQDLRTKLNNVVDIYEDQRFGPGSNIGTYKLKQRGDKIHFCFQGDASILEEKQKKKKDNKGEDREEPKVQCLINLSQQAGQVMVYVSEFISKPSESNHQIKVDGRFDQRMNMKIKFITGG